MGRMRAEVASQAERPPAFELDTASGDVFTNGLATPVLLHGRVDGFQGQVSVKDGELRHFV